MKKLAKFTWLLLAYNVLVILWGAFVRATGSGAGCGAHWPLCNGVVIPRSAQIETLIELAHRVSSGLTLVLVVILVVWVWRITVKGCWLRKAAGAVLLFTLMEALVGAGLVLFELVAHNASLTRAISMMVHLVNTFLLLGSLSLTAWWSSFGEPDQVRLRTRSGLLMVAALVALLVLGASGALTALGDTLFPSVSLAEGLQQDINQSSHLLLRLRIFHPFIAVLTVLMGAAILRKVQEKTAVHLVFRRLSTAVFILMAVQLGLGFINVVLLAPVWMQIVHLLVTCLIWIGMVLCAGLVWTVTFLQPTDGTVHQRVQVEKAQPSQASGDKME